MEQNDDLALTKEQIANRRDFTKDEVAAADPSAFAYMQHIQREAAGIPISLNNIPFEDIIDKQNTYGFHCLVKVETGISYDQHCVKDVKEQVFREKFEKHMNEAAQTMGRALEVMFNAAYADLMGEVIYEEKKIPNVQPPNEA